MKIHDFQRKKQKKDKITFLTCYDYSAACIVADSKLDCILVGDSVAMVMHGYDSTVMATMEMMILHTQAVARGIKQQFLVSDMPFLSYRISQETTMRYVMQLMQAGAHAVKIEGGDDDICKTVQHITQSGVPVIGHIGLTPQSIHQLGGYRVQGKDQQQAAQFIAQAKALEAAGVIALVLECVPSALAETITQNLTIPTVGIGAGHGTDGQILVWHDFLGLQDELTPKFVKQYTQTKQTWLQAINAYVDEVKMGAFPRLEHAY